MQPVPSLVAALALVTTVACGAPSQPAKTQPAATQPGPTNPEPTTAGPATTGPAAVVPPVAGAPGPAYFAVEGRGVVVLDDAGFRLLEGAPPTLLRDLQLGPDGALWVLGDADIYRLEGERLVGKTGAGLDDIGDPAGRLAVAPGGDLWITGVAGVSRWDGAAWTTEARARIGAGDDPLQGITVDRDGRVWVASTQAVHVREGEAWRDVDLTRARRGPLRLRDLELAPDGAVHLLIDEALLKFDGTGATITAVPVGVEGSAQMSDLGFALGGSIGVISGRDVFHVPAGGSPRRYSSMQSRDFKADGITALAPDDAGRLWVGSSIGVAVIVPGAARVEWLSGSVPELLGELRGIIVVGAGPTTLPASRPQARGGLSGKLLRAGAPVVGVTVELCPSPASAFKKSPCQDAALKFTSKTDATGVWTVDGVPLGSYGLAVKDGKKWRVAPTRDLGDGMRAGVVHDTGSITLEK